MENDMDNEFYTYVHIRLDTGRVFYVGKGKKDRFKSTNKRNNHWKNIVKKAGFVPKIVFFNLSEQSAFETERSLISIYKSIGYDLANKTIGGEGPSGMKHSEETKLKWSIAKQGKKRGCYSKDHRDQISKSLKGRVVSFETRQKISEKTKAAMKNPDVKQKMSCAKLGKLRPKHTDETKLKMSIAAKQRWADKRKYHDSQE